MESIVRARLFELVDDNGNRRATLGTDREGSPSFKLYARDGIARVQLAVSELDQASLVLADVRGEPRVSVSVDSRGTATIALLETETKAPVMFRLNADGTYDGSFDNPVSFDKPKLRLVPPGDKKDR